MYGLVGVFALLRTWLSQFDVGLTPALSREMARFRAGAHDAVSIRNLLRSIEWLTLGLALFIFLLVWCGGEFLASNWLKLGDIPKASVISSIRWMGLVIALQFFDTTYRGALLGLQHQVTYNILCASFATLRHVGSWLVLALLAPTLEMFFAWQALVAGCNLLTTAFFVHRLLPKSSSETHFSLNALRDVWRFSAGMLGITSLALLLTQVDKTLLSHLIPLEEFALYALAGTAAGILNLAITPVLQAIYPRMVELVTREDETGFVKSYHASAQVITALGAPVLILLAMYPEGVLFLWTNDRNIAEASGPILAVLACGTFANVVMRMPYESMLAHGWTSLTLRVNVVAVLFLVPLLLILVPRYGAIGAAWVWLCLNLGYIVFTIQLMHRRILQGEMLRWYGFDVGFPLLAAASVGWLFRVLQPSSYESRLFLFLQFTLVGILALLAAVAASPALRLIVVERLLKRRSKD